MINSFADLVKDLRVEGCPLGEVIEARSEGFLAQCPRARLHQPPALGEFVRILPPGIRAVIPDEQQFELDPFAEPTIDFTPLGKLPEGATPGAFYALVAYSVTGSMEAGRRPAAYGLEMEELQQEQPQIFELICTTFEARFIAYAGESRLHIGLPPRPPRLHAFVSACLPGEVVALTESLEFLQALLNTNSPVPSDDLIAASLRQAAELRPDPFSFLVRAGKMLALQLGADACRLNALLQRLEM